MPKILVTGGAGFIGSHTVIELLNNGYDVVIVDNLVNSEKFILKKIEEITGKTPTFYQVDCANTNELVTVFNQHPDIALAIHFAALKAVKESIEKPLEYYRNNLLSLISLLDLMDRFGIEKFVFSSSCTIYGEDAPLPMDENLQIMPTTSPYGRTKQMCESILADYAVVNSNFKYISLRYFNPIGAHPSGLIGELPIGSPNNLVPYITQTAAGVRDELKVFGSDYSTPDGTAQRDYIDIMDLAQAHVQSVDRLINRLEPQQFEAFNLGSGKPVSVKEIIDTFERVNGIHLKWSFAPRRAGDLPTIYADSKKAKEVLKWEAKTSLAESLANAWKWERSHRNID